jgi:hypothetical protein
VVLREVKDAKRAMTDRQKTIGAIAVLTAAIGVYAEVSYQAKLRSARERMQSAPKASATSVGTPASMPPPPPR